MGGWEASSDYLSKELKCLAKDYEKWKSKDTTKKVKNEVKIRSRFCI